MKRVRSPEYEDNARLDDLLRYEDTPAGPAAPGPAPSWLPRAALHTFIASALVYTTLHIFNLAPPYALIIAVCAGAVLTRRAIALTAEPDRQRTHDIVRAHGPVRRIEPGGWYTTGDGMAEAVRRWDRRLDWGATAVERFEHTVSGRLGDLVDERLRQRHGISRASDPGRARALLGEEVWTLLDGPLDHVPGPREVAALAKRMESL